MSDGSVSHVPVTDVAGLIASGGVLIDVREHQETAMGKAPSVTCMPMQSFNVDLLPPEVPLVFICRSGNRSDAVATALAGMGFTAYNVLGGMLAWASAGYPIVAEDGSPGAIL